MENSKKAGEAGMSYQSPIDIIVHDMQMKTEDEICKAVQKVGINVGKDELIRALQYDRKQYEKGYADRDVEIVRCKDCKHGQLINGEIWCLAYVPNTLASPDWFCADGVKKDE